MKNLYFLFFFALLFGAQFTSAQVTVNTSGKLAITTPTGTSNFIDLNGSGDLYSLDMQSGDLAFRPNGSSADATYALKLADEAGYKATFYGMANLGAEQSGIILQADGAEALWYNPAYFSWGFGKDWNYFADEILIGSTGGAPFTPSTADGLTISSSRDIRLDGTSSKYLRFTEAGTQKGLVGHSGTHLILQNDEAAGIVEVDGQTGVDLRVNNINYLTVESTGLVEMPKTSEALRLSGSGSYMTFYNGATYNGYVWHTNTSMYLMNRHATGNLYLGAGNGVRTTITPAGNVGIGTINPTEKLHVVGQIAMENPGFNKIVLSGVNGSQRFALSTNTTTSTSRSFFTMWGDETHGIAGADVTRAGELAFQCKYLQVSANKPSIGFAALDFEVKANGNTYAYGDLYANGVLISSDRRLKKDIKEFSLGLEQIKKLKPKQYFYNGKGGTETTRLHTGVIAQEIEKIIPESVSTYRYDDNYNDVHEEFLAVDEGMIKFVLINAVKELDSKNEKLIDENQALEDRMNKLEADNAELNALLTSVLERIESGDHVNAVIGENSKLEQNVPNPFSNETVIKYVLTDKDTNSKMSIYNMEGKLIKEIKINSVGAGQINLSTSQLAPGTYTYTLQSDAGFIGTKKMMHISSNS